MAQLNHTKVLLLSVLLFLSVSICFSAWLEPQSQTTQLSSNSSRASVRRMLDTEHKLQDKDKPLKKKTTTLSTKNHTKLIKPTSTPSKNQTKTIKSDIIISSKTIIKSNLISSKNQTKILKSNLSSPKNQTKISTKTIKSNNTSSKNQTKPLKPTDTPLNLKKLNNSTTPKVKKLNVTSKPYPSKKSLDLAKASNKATKPSTSTKDKNTNQTKATKQQTKNKKPNKQTPPSWIMQDEDENEEEDLVSHFRDLPNKFHRTLIPDLERISTTSKAYITKANNEITKGFKPYVGKKYAPTVATAISIAFILIPLLLVSLLCTKIKAYFSLQKILIFIQIYLSIYFTILCVTTLFTGLEPLKFLYSTSQSTYLCLQVLQTLAYVFYLLLLLMYLVLVFSTDSGLGSKFLGLGQVLVGFSVGLHYYVTVFHRVVLQQPPKTNWKIHAIYATCFLIVGLLSRADRRKMTYLEDGGGEGKKN